MSSSSPRVGVRVHFDTVCVLLIDFGIISDQISAFVYVCWGLFTARARLFVAKLPPPPHAR